MGPHTRAIQTKAWTNKETRFSFWNFYLIDKGNVDQTHLVIEALIRSYQYQINYQLS